MSILVTDKGFSADDWTKGFCNAGAANDCPALDLHSDADPALVTLTPVLRLVRIDFPSFADGRGFTLARALRLRGYQGRLRAKGHVLSDQYAMARRSGFDEVEIDDAHAVRQPEAEWLFRTDWEAHDYQARLRGTASVA